MSAPDPLTGSYRLASTARLIEDGGRRLRIRTGVWNFEEAVIDVSNESPAVARTVRAALLAAADRAVTPAEHLDPELQPIERANVSRLFTDLTQAGVLVPADDRASQDTMAAALLGRLTSPYPGGFDLAERTVLFWSDTEAATGQAQALARSLRLTLGAIPAATLETLAQADLTSRIDGFGTGDLAAQARESVAGAAAIVTCMQRPNLPLLRNLNRVLEGQDKPWINAFIDGPFSTVVGLKSPHTGCFECFEQRALARLEDHVVYHEFAHAFPPPAQEYETDAPMMSWLTVLAVTEGYLHAALGTSRLAGRVLAIHQPTLEIQSHELLRMPSCPACGRISRQRISEINFNSRAAVDRIISEVLR